VTVATLQDIRNKVRKLTGSSNDLSLTNSQIDDYINSFYLYDLPAEFRSLQLKDIYTFTTVRGVATYSWDNENYLSVETPVYLNKREISLFFNEREFFGFVPGDMYSQTISQGDGTVGPYTATLQNTPVIPSVNNNPANSSYPSSRVVNFMIGANSSFGSTQSVSDISAGATGTLTGDGTGTINYSTGALSVTFTSVVPSGEDIVVNYLSKQITRPIAILYLQNQLTLSPPPDKAYIVEVTVYRQPTSVLLESTANSPELKEWWELIATVGIVALVDDATGYVEERQRNELQKILEKYISEELREWTKKFPDQFFKQIYRLYGWEWGEFKKNHPQCVGNIINKYIYDRLPPGVLDELKNKNPITENGKRKHMHHQFLTEDVGDKNLSSQISQVVTLMRVSDNMDQFKNMIEKISK